MSDALAETPTLARLSTLQWANTVRDLLKIANPGDLDNALTKDPVVRFDNEADSLFVGQELHDDLQSEAERLAALVVADPAALAKLVPASAPTDAAGKAKVFLQDFGRRAYRRPLTTVELADYTALFNQGPSLVPGLGAFQAGVRVTLEAFLQAPQFLYRTSIGAPAVNGRARLTDYEIAANLSYALTNAPPDVTLADAADKGSLSAVAAIEAQARRLLPTPSGKSAIDRFYFQYFGLGQYDTLQKEAKFTDFANVGPQLREEATQLLRFLFDQKLGLRDIFTTPVAFVNAPVAKLYGLSGTFEANAWKQVALDPAQRPGLLTRLGFVSYFGYQDRPNTIKRGASINNRILCAEMHPPEDLVIPPFPEPDPAKTNREQVTELTKSAACAGCHTSFINPAGFAFENFDGLGRYRTTDQGKPIDASGSYNFEEGPAQFSNVAEFSKALSTSSQAHACYTKRWAANLYARMPRREDENAAAQLAAKSIKENISSMDVVVSLITNEAFVTRVEGTK